MPLSEERIYRIHGGGAKPNGVFWTPIDPRTLERPRNALGLPPANSGELMTVGELIDPTGVEARPALPFEDSAGGALEYVVPNPLKQVHVIEIVRMDPPV